MSHTERRAPRGALVPVFLTVFIDLLGFGIVIPLLPIYSEVYGASGLALGLLFSSFSLMQLIFAPFWGRLSDKVGRRPVLIGTLLGTAGSYVLFGLADDMTMLFVSRMLAGFFGANVATAQAYVADVTTPAERAKGMGMIGAAFGLGFTFGPLIGGVMVCVSMGAPGFVAAGLSTVAALVAISRLHEPPRHSETAGRVLDMDSLSTSLRTPRIGIVLLLYFLAIMAFSGFETMFIRFGLDRFPGAFESMAPVVTAIGLDCMIDAAASTHFGVAALSAGVYMFAIGLISAIIQGGLIRRLVPRYGETKLIVAGPFLLGLGFLVVALAPTWALVIAGCAIMPMGFGLNNPSLQGLLSRAVPDHRQGAFLGLNQSLGSLARVVGPLVAGLFFDTAGATAPFYVSAALLALGTLIAIGYHRRYASSFAEQVREDGESAHGHA